MAHPNGQRRQEQRLAQPEEEEESRTRRQGLRIGSFCSGIGGIELGLERAGLGYVVWQCEIDPWCRSILEQHWPGVLRWDDLRTLPPWECDLLVGGFPCQPYSKAGAQLAAEDPRDLLPAVIRAIGLVRSRFVLLENVEPFLQFGMGRLLGALASLGYDAEWHCIPAAAVGAPHLRDRVWILAYANGSGHLHGQPVLDPAEGGVEALSLSGGCGEAMADTNGQRQQQPPRRVSEIWGRAGNGRWWATEPPVGRVAHGVPHRVDRIKGLGNAVVPQVPEAIGRRLARMIEACPACRALFANQAGGDQ